MIDIKSPPESPAHDQAELFLTLIRSILQKEAIYTAINLADQSFTHVVTGNYPIDNNIDNSDPFTYTITNQYIPNEFYGIMINTSTSKKSTIGYG
jgi:hypothetical protein